MTAVNQTLVYPVLFNHLILHSNENCTFQISSASHKIAINILFIQICQRYSLVKTKCISFCQHVNPNGLRLIWRKVLFSKLVSKSDESRLALAWNDAKCILVRWHHKVSLLLVSRLFLTDIKLQTCVNLCIVFWSIHVEFEVSTLSEIS